MRHDARRTDRLSRRRGEESRLCSLPAASSPAVHAGDPGAIGLLVVGASRQRTLERALATGEQAPLPFPLVAAFTLGGTLLAVMTAVLVLAQI